MKIILTENQIEFIRRYNQLKELVDNGIDVLNQSADLCDYTFSDFLEEVCWQVSDKKELLQLSGIGYNDLVHMWVRNNFHTHIRKMFEKFLQEESCFDDFYDVNDEYDNEEYV